MLKKFSTFLIEFAISAALVVFILRLIDLHELLAAVLRTKFVYLFIGMVLYPLGQIFCAIKWQYLARALGIQKDLRPMMGLYFMGMFFNLFLPTSIGGDITRGLYLNPGSGKTRSSLLSVFAERGTGLISMTVLASIAMLSPYGAALPLLLRYGFPAMTAFCLLLLPALPWFLSKTHTRMRRVVCEDLIIFWKNPKICVKGILYSAAFHLILVGIHVCIAKALSLSIPVPYHFITISLACLISLLPSFNGIGLRDASYMVLLSFIGIDYTLGLLFSIHWFFVMTVSSLIGCIVFLMRGLSSVPVVAGRRK